MQFKLNKTLLKIIGIGVAIVLLFVAFFLVLSHIPWGGEVVEEEQETQAITLDGKSYLPKKNLETTLLLGTDKREGEQSSESYNNNQQADFFMLLILDKDTKTSTILHLNRDTMTDIPMLGVRGETTGTKYGQLALAHTYGSGGNDSCRNTVKAVSTLLYNVPIDHYVAFTMDAVPKLSDAVGGVTVELLDDFTALYPSMKQGETVTLRGEMALAYVRTRYGLEDSSNLHRMERQRQYLSALEEKLHNANQEDNAFLTRTLKTLSEDMTSDCTIYQLNSLYEKFSHYTHSEMQTTKGEAKKGDTYMEFYVEDDALKQQVLELFYTPVDTAP